MEDSVAVEDLEEAVLVVEVVEMTAVNLEGVH